MSRFRFFLLAGLILFILILGGILWFMELRNQRVADLPLNPFATPTPFILSPTPTLFIREGGGLETEEFKRQEREFVEQTPILQKLPVGSPYFSIEYMSEQHLIVHAKTDNKERDYQEARIWFTNNGINSANITIEYD